MKNAKFLHLANFLTLSRIAVSVALLFCQPFEPLFWAFYAWCGLSDMLDGPIARKSKRVSRTGAILDSIADFIFVVVCCIKMLPEIAVPTWLWVWIAIIAVIKLINVISGFICHHRLVMPHTIANKLTGGLLFALPVVMQFVPLSIPTAVVCAVATFAAMQEGHLIRTTDFQ